ncbi:MAG: alanine--tRNA ligase, partial [Marinilabiliales bacterium]
MTSKEIRRTFFDFFSEKGHRIVESAPMVIKNDPTLMFTNAGMNQFKDIFLGNRTAKDSRVADSQKCLRVSGKHNDLEEVGRDTYHHTMFEMLGNWSFGDYFKNEAIDYAWELLTKVYKISAERLYATIFEGSEEDKVDRDIEAFSNWNKYLPEERILNGSKKDNFWEMGETGPCGPCSEIHIDLRDEEEIHKVPGKDLVNKDHPQVIEIWNLVFIQYNRKSNGQLEALPAKHVDTGMGFERLCMVIQGKKSNYDTDVFQTLINEIEKQANKKYTYGQNLPDETEEINVAMRVIADHLRAVSFSIADGQLPSNTGAGYVIRRILRRAIRYGYQILDLKEPFIYKLTQILSDQLGDIYPEILKQKKFIEKVIHEEENSFHKTLETGLKRIDEYCKQAKTKNISVVDGHTVFELYDTFGFPIDLTSLIAEDHNMQIDEQGFNEALKKQKERSRQASNIQAEDWVIVTEDNREEFIGYDYLSTEIKIV